MQTKIQPQVQPPPPPSIANHKHEPSNHDAHKHSGIMNEVVIHEIEKFKHAYEERWSLK